ncbi:MAG: bifunctional serine/threonine-protein kinase/formylglycine-generating enzyme family protein, partial [Myxococcota bacterium]
KYLVLQLLPGEHSHQFRVRQPGRHLPGPEVVRVGLECLDALVHAHNLGVHHHDLKPSNILLTRAGSTKICDFGLARLIGRQMASRNSAGFVAGSPAFLSPERIRGEDGDHRSDLYALAATMYALGNGRWLFAGQQPAILHGHLYREVPDSPVLPPSLHEVLSIALAKDPDQRFQSARDMAEALRVARDTEPTIKTMVSVNTHGRSNPAPSSTTPDDPEDGPLEVIEAIEVIDGEDTTSFVSPSAVPTGEVVIPEEMAVIGELSFVSAHGGSMVVAGFMLDITPVTNRDYVAFVRECGALPPQEWGGMRPPEEILDLPVVGINHRAATDYAHWRGKRLPTSAEWEAAARQPDGRAFPWGDEMRAELCNVRGSGPKGLTPVRHYDGGRSVDGCYDLVGNAWEWTAEEVGDQVPEEGYAWVFGGSYKHRGAQRGAIARNSILMLNEYPYVGFRCAKEI